MSDCPTPQQLSAFIAGQLEPAELARIEAHIDQCPACEAALIQLARQTLQPTALVEGGSLLGRGAEVSRFLVVDFVASGAMGTVYSAYDPQLDRKVALKVLDAWKESVSKRTALALREARLLAQLNHPNVVTLYEAGESNGVAYVAMELVDGTTLAQWLQTPRSIEEITDAFVSAAQGLAAVHQVGIAHGDFKPANVLMGADGRVRVTDFGLATHEVSEGWGGTIAYAAPEVLAGRPSTALSDQYSFCLAMTEALTGQRKGGLQALPRHLRVALTRGQSLATSDRFESMTALIDALRPRRRTLLVPVAAGFVCVALVAFAVGAQDRCAAPAATLAAFWSDVARAQLQRHVGDAPMAGHTVQYVDGVMRAWQAAWASAFSDACRAARSNTDAPPLQEARQRCLEDRRNEALVVTKLLQTPAPDLAKRAPQLVDGLPPPTLCNDRRALTDAPKPPSDPKLREAVTQVERALADAKALKDLGRFKAANEQLEALLGQAHQLGYAPLTARVAFRAGSVALRLNAHPRALQLLNEAVAEGIAGRADEPAAQAATLLVYELGVVDHQPDEASRQAALAEALIRRRGGDDELSAGLLLNQALVAESTEQLERALELMGRSVQAFERAADGKYTQGNALLNQARLEFMLGRFDEATKTVTRALDIIRKTRGDGHPNVSVGETTFGVLARERGDFTGAAEHLGVALNIATQAFGPTHDEVLGLRDELVRTTLARGQVEEARRSSLALVAEVEQAGQPLPTEPLITLTECQLAAGDLVAAKAALARAEQASTVVRTGELQARLALAKARTLRDTAPAEALAAALLAQQKAWARSRVATEATALVAALRSAQP